MSYGNSYNQGQNYSGGASYGYGQAGYGNGGFGDSFGGGWGASPGFGSQPNFGAAHGVPGGNFQSGGNAGAGGAGGGVDRSKSVFVGNIPYDATEHELVQLFSQAGNVVSFRLITDRETGRPKGFGFCEFGDQASTEVAMQMLNGCEVRGRQLRVDRSK